MSPSFSLLFFLKDKYKPELVKVPIYLRLTVNGKRCALSISRKIEPEKWHSKSGKMRGSHPEAVQLNQYLDTVRSKINRIHQRFVDEEKPFTALDIKNAYLDRGDKLKTLVTIFEEHNAQMHKLIGKDFALGTWLRYTTTLKHIKAYIKSEYRRTDIPVRDVDLKFIKGFEYYLKVVRNCCHNSALKYINHFKKIVRIAVAHEWISKDPFYNYKIQFQTVEREYLTNAELQAIINLEVRLPRIEIVRDMFIFCCFTGLAYIDVKKLTPNNIVPHIDGSQWIQSSRQKPVLNWASLYCLPL